MKLTQKAPSGKQKLIIVSYNPGLKTEFHISCSNVPKTILDFAKLSIISDFLPQHSNFFTRIYLPYPWHFATLCLKPVSFPFQGALDLINVGHGGSAGLCIEHRLPGLHCQRHPIWGPGGSDWFGTHRGPVHHNSHYICCPWPPLSRPGG